MLEKAKLRLLLGMALILGASVWVGSQAMGGRPIIPMRDFVEYYSAGQVFLERGNPYDGEVLLPIQKHISGRTDDGDTIMMWNPPWVFAIVAPLSALPPVASHQAWLLLQFASVLLSLAALWHVYGGAWKNVVWIMGLAATFPPVLFVMWWGQIGGLILLGLAGFLFFRAKKMYYLAGVFASLTAIKPHLLFAFGLCLVLETFTSRAARKVVLAGGLTIGLCVLGTYLFHPEVYAHYRNANWDTSTAFNPSPKDFNQPLISYWLRIWFATDTFRVQFIPTALVALAVAVYWYARKQKWNWNTELPRLIFASTLSCAYGAWLFDLVILLVPMTQALVALSNKNAKRSTAVVVGIYAGVTFMGVVYPMFLMQQTIGYAMGLHHFIFFTPVCLGLWLLVQQLCGPYNNASLPEQSECRPIELSSLVAGSAGSSVPWGSARPLLKSP